MEPTTRILIVDDYAAVRADLRMVLELLNGVEVVGEASNGEEAIRQAQKLRPDLIIMDLEMPGMDGCSAIRRIKNEFQAIHIYVLTVHGSPKAEQAAVQAGADAFFVKGEDGEALLEKIRSFQSIRKNSLD